MLWLVAMAVFMQMLDTTIVNTALPSMAVSLSEPPLRMQAVVSYALTVAMLDDELASSGNSLLSMVMMLAMSLGVAIAGGLLGAFGGAAVNPGRADALAAFRWSFVCVGLVTMASAALFAQLESTHHIPEAKVQEAEPA
jgi:MFS family permease